MENVNLKTKNLIICGLFTALLAVCSWICIPSAVPFTLQTFAVFLIILVLGPKWSVLCIISYIILGCAGIPVFAGFQSGLGVIIGPLGGYIIGFIPCCILSGFLLKKTDKKIFVLIYLFIGLLTCYIFGSLWYFLIYMEDATGGIIAILSTCVIPFIVPDILKIIFAAEIYSRIKKRI